MILELRRRHRRMWLLLLVLLPILYALALWVRPEPAVEHSLPAELLELAEPGS